MLYQLVEDWAQLREGWSFLDVGSIAIDNQDRVYVLNRGEHPIIVYERDGSFVGSWGEGMFQNAHGAYIDEEDHIYCVDRNRHVLWKFTSEGELLMTIGELDEAAPHGEPFNLPTDVALAPGGDLYVSDGYGNNAVFFLIAKLNTDGVPPVRQSFLILGKAAVVILKVASQGGKISLPGMKITG